MGDKNNPDEETGGGWGSWGAWAANAVKSTTETFSEQAFGSKIFQFFQKNFFSEKAFSKGLQKRVIQKQHFSTKTPKSAFFSKFHTCSGQKSIYGIFCIYTGFYGMSIYTFSQFFPDFTILSNFPKKIVENTFSDYFRKCIFTAFQLKPFQYLVKLSQVQKKN